MKVIKGIAKDSVNKNKKNNISVKVSIFLAVLILSSFIIQFTSINKNNLDYAKEVCGDYVANIKDLSKEDLNKIKNNDKLSKIEVSTRNTYDNNNLKRPKIQLIKYQNTMINLKKMQLLKGDCPSNAREVLVPDQLLKENPSIKFGGNITIGEKEYVVKGTYSAKMRSFYKTYPVFGYVSEEDIEKGNNFEAYIWIKNARNTYTVIPSIVSFINKNFKELVNEKKLEYNEAYLSLKNIYENGIMPRDKMIEMIRMGIILVLIIILFIVIISNSFIVWSYRDLKEIGILKSVGMTKRQVNKLVRYKIINLATIPIFAGITMGHLLIILVNLIMRIVEKVNNIPTRSYFYKIRFNPIEIILLIIASYIMVTIAAFKPAKLSNKITIMDAIKNNIPKKNLKYSNIPYGKNVIKSMAKENHKTYKKNYIAMTISLVTGCLIFSAILIYRSYTDLMEKFDSCEAVYNIQISTCTENDIKESLTDDIRSIKGIEDAIIYSSRLLYYDNRRENLLTDSYKNAVANTGNVVLYNDEILVFGIEDKKFNNQFEKYGLDYKKYYSDGQPKAAIVDSAPINLNKPFKRLEYMPFINKNTDKIFIKERKGSSNVGYDTDFEVIDRINEVPFGIDNISKDTIILVMPLSHFSKYYDNLKSYKSGNIAKVHRIGVKADKNNLKGIKEELKDLISDTIPETDTNIETIDETKAMGKANVLHASIIVYSFMIFLLIIGFVNAFTSINLTMKSRNRDITILRSVGLEKDRLEKMFKHEAMILIGKILVFLISFIFMFTFGYSYLLKRMFSGIEIILNINWLLIISYLIVMIIGIDLSYGNAVKNMIKSSIIENIATE